MPPNRVITARRQARGDVELFRGMIEMFGGRRCISNTPAAALYSKYNIRKEPLYFDKAIE